MILNCPQGFFETRSQAGKVTEWPKVRDWKSRVRATAPGVRIPPFPPETPSKNIKITYKLVLIVQFIRVKLISV